MSNLRNKKLGAFQGTRERLLVFGLSCQQVHCTVPTVRELSQKHHLKQIFGKEMRLGSQYRLFSLQ